MTIHQILIKYWGYTSFRPLQEDIINSVMEGHDTLALLPTGGGKSLCFQVPALAREGLCIVVSPLIALMKDQVENLKKRGIKAIAVYSGMNYNEIDIALDNAAYSDVKFLYISPERLETELFKARVRKMKVSMLAIDEAHCISQWGYDFRPPYLRIAALRQFLPGVPVLALTATATPAVVDDIQQKLEFVSGKVFQKSFERKNLTYMVFHEEDKYGRLLRIAKRISGSGIVYVRNRRKCREVSDFLTRNGISADYYHAGLDPDVRDRKQNEWMKGTKKIIVSTNAFGMGIDKPDVRYVVHLDLPDSPEAYFQEAGRAGRDEKPAWAVILWEQVDIDDLRNFFEAGFPPLDTIRNVYSALSNYLKLAVGSGKESVFDFSLPAFCEQYRFSTVTAYGALKILEKEGYLHLSDAIHTPSKIHIRMSNDNLYRFQVDNPRYDSFLKLLLRSYSGLFSGFVRINEQEISNRGKISPAEIDKMLRHLEQYEVLHYAPKSDSPRITFLTERLDPKHLSLSNENYFSRKEAAKARMEAVIEYVTGINKCRSRSLLEYFGQKDAPRCGACDICKKRNEIGLTEIEFDSLVEQLKPMLRNDYVSLHDIIPNIKGFSGDKVIAAINWLADHDKIKTDGQGRFRWP
jgi:ATP-dependent DNA helicase RecQ